MYSSNLVKISALTVLAISISACSSNNHSTQNISTPLPSQPAADKAAADKAAADKAAADKAAADKAAADKAAADKAAADKAAADKAAADKAAADKAAADKAAADKAAADKAAADKAAADKAAADKAAADKAAADKAAADKAAADKAAADKAAADKAAADKAAADKAAADKAAADKAAADKATADKAAADKAAADKAAADKATADKSKISIDKGISDNDYPIGEITPILTGSTASLTNDHVKAAESEKMVYNQKYSVVLGTKNSTVEYNNDTGYTYSFNSEMSVSSKGLQTAADAIPNIGTATYIGKAFTTQDTAEDSKYNNYGVLNYSVDFNKKTGSGSITFEEPMSINPKMIQNKTYTSAFGTVVKLDQGSISGTGITSTAQLSDKTGTYSLGFYGPKAEEVAGKVSFDGKDAVGFGGTRGDISK